MSSPSLALCMTARHVTRPGPYGLIKIIYIEKWNVWKRFCFFRHAFVFCGTNGVLVIACEAGGLVPTTPSAGVGAMRFADPGPVGDAFPDLVSV